jgi:subtilisin family serine protease
MNPPWGLDRIGQRNLPLNQTYSYTTNGTGVNVYIIDTGIRRTHQQFAGRAFVGFDAIGDGQNTNDCNGHGTHVSGTVGGSTFGVAKNVHLFAVRVLNCNGSGTTSGVIAGVDWVTTNHISPAVANMSLGGGASTALDNAVINSINSGVTYAIAAGNSNTNAANSSPARVGAAITVGATTMTDARSSFSNFGSVVDIFAPGSSILSSFNTSDTATATLSGTSMATPHVAGVAARVLQGNPGFTPAQVRNEIVNTATLNHLSGIPAGTANRLLFRSSAQ